MDAETTRWVAGIIVVIVLGLVGTVYYMGRQRDDKQDEKIGELRDDLSRHVAADIQSHSEHGERIATLEERSVTQHSEIGKLRDMRHEINAETSRTIMENYKDMLDRLNAAVQRLMERFVK